MPAPSPMFIPARLRSNGRHGSGIHQPKRVEAAERQARERVGAAGDRRVERGPARIASAAWPIAIVLDAQAATTQDRWPFEPEPATR